MPSTMSLKGKRIVITGASRGIGEGLAELLVERGAHLALLSRNAERLQATVKLIQAKYPAAKVFHRALDVSDTKGTAQFLSDAAQVLGPLDGLVNNAAILNQAFVGEIPEKDLHDIFNVNVFGLVGITQAFVRATKARKAQRASIVNVSSVGGIQGLPKFPGLSAYCATKFTVIGFTEVWAEELKAANIRVNAVAPGGTETDMLKQAFPDYEPRLKPIDVAKAIAYLLDDEESGAVTGIVLQVPN